MEDADAIERIGIVIDTGTRLVDLGRFGDSKRTGIDRSHGERVNNDDIDPPVVNGQLVHQSVVLCLYGNARIGKESHCGHDVYRVVGTSGIKALNGPQYGAGGGKRSDGPGLASCVTGHKSITLHVGDEIDDTYISKRLTDAEISH